MQKVKAFGLTALIFGLAAVLETKSALGAFALNEGLSAYLHAGLSIACALLAVVFSKIAGHYKADARPFVRELASWARAISVACIIVPTIYLGTALRHDRIEREWTAYQGSPAYEADAALVADLMSDRYDRQEARMRLTKQSAGIDITHGEFWTALALQLLIIGAAGIPLFAPATEEEVRHWRKVEAGKKAAATRKRNAAKRKAKKSGSVIPFRKKQTA